MIYLDNAATTFIKPKSVYKAVEDTIKKYSANPGRSGHKLSLKAAEMLYEARERVALFFGLASPEKVVFTYNATYALNLAIKTLVREKCHIIISDMEHNSVLRPVNRICMELGAEYSVYNSRSEDLLSEIESHIRSDTDCIISTLASNVTGREIPLEVLSQIKKKHNLKLILDGAQIAGHKRINLAECEFDAFAAPAHKAMLGIMGLGFCILGKQNSYESFIEGGTGSESKRITMPDRLPEAYEAGTVALPAIAALSAGIDFIEKIGIDSVESKLRRLTELTAEQMSTMPFLDIHSAENGVISFSVIGRDSESVSAELDKCNICTRAGFHCAPLAHKALGTYERGTVRASFSYFNSFKEAEQLCDVLRAIYK